MQQTPKFIELTQSGSNYVININVIHIMNFVPRGTESTITQSTGTEIHVVEPIEEIRHRINIA